MKKNMLIMAFASALVLLVAFPASAGTNLTRTVTDTYNFPALGQGDLGGLCVGPDFDLPQLDSCIVAPVQFGEDHVSVTVTDSANQPVYVSIQQDNNPEFAIGCGTITDFPIVDSGPGGTAAEPVYVFPWHGPGINDGVTPCNPGSTNAGGGAAVFSFYDDVA
jgi:hypothetical protein